MIALVSIWEYAIFLAAADLIMILRVYAMWNQSKSILYILLFVYVAQVIVSFVVTGIYNNPNTHYLVTITQVFDVSFCHQPFVNTSSLLGFCIVFSRLLLCVALFVFAVVASLQQSISLYKATQQWQLNRYMQLFVRDGSLYFLANALVNVVEAVEISLPSTINTTWIAFLGSFSVIALCNMVPRFLISVRELYDRELRGRCQGIDTGFGVISLNRNRTTPEIGFPDVASGQGQVAAEDADGSGSIRLEVFVLEDGDNVREVLRCKEAFWTKMT